MQMFSTESKIIVRAMCVLLYCIKSGKYVQEKMITVKIFYVYGENLCKNCTMEMCRDNAVYVHVWKHHPRHMINEDVYEYDRRVVIVDIIVILLC